MGRKRRARARYFRRAHRKPKQKKCQWTEKVMFETEEAARFAVGRAVVSSDHRRREKRSYLCDKCGAWHVTSFRTPKEDSREQI